MMNQIQIPLARMQEYMNKKEYLKALKEAQAALNLIDVEKTPYLGAVILLHVLFCQAKLGKIPQAANTYYTFKRFIDSHPQVVREKFLLSIHKIALNLHSSHLSLSLKLWDLAWVHANKKNLEIVKKHILKELVPLLLSISPEQFDDVSIIQSWIKKALTHISSKREAFNLHIKNIIFSLEAKNLDEASASLEAAENLASAMVNTELIAIVKKLEIIVLLKDVEWQLFSFDSNKPDKISRLDENILIAKLEKAESLAREFNDHKSLFQAKLLRGLLFKYMNSYRKALEEWKEAMELGKEGVPSQVIHQLTVQIALILAKERHYHHARDLLDLIERKNKDNLDEQLISQIKTLKTSLEQLINEQDKAEEQGSSRIMSELEQFPFFKMGPGTISFLRKESLLIQEKLQQEQASEKKKDLVETPTSEAEEQKLLTRETMTVALESSSESQEENEVFDLQGNLDDLLSPDDEDHAFNQATEPATEEREVLPESRESISTPISREHASPSPVTLEESNDHDNHDPHFDERQLERMLEEKFGEETMSEAVQGQSRELVLNLIVNLLKSKGYSVEANLDAVSDPNVIATKGKLKKHRILISICEDPIDAGFAATLLSGHLLQGTKVVYLLNGDVNEIVGSEDVVIIQQIEELMPLLK